MVGVLMDVLLKWNMLEMAEEENEIVGIETEIVILVVIVIMIVEMIVLLNALIAMNLDIGREFALDLPIEESVMFVLVLDIEHEIALTEGGVDRHTDVDDGAEVRLLTEDLQAVVYLLQEEGEEETLLPLRMIKNEVFHLAVNAAQTDKHHLPQLLPQSVIVFLFLLHLNVPGKVLNRLEVEEIHRIRYQEKGIEVNQGAQVQ
jgi:hypothetical protein